MKRYIKTDSNNHIIKIFTWYNRPAFDGSEIELDDNAPDLTINGKNILNEFGFPIFIYDEGVVSERVQAEIDSDPDFITFYKQLKKQELQNYIGLNTLDWLNFHTWQEVLTAWNNFKSNASGWTTKQDVDNAFNIATAWLQS